MIAGREEEMHLQYSKVSTYLSSSVRHISVMRRCSCDVLVCQLLSLCLQPVTGYCSHLLLGFPLPQFPFTLSSKMIFSLCVCVRVYINLGTESRKKFKIGVPREEEFVNETALQSNYWSSNMSKFNHLP